jgi:hypothetical protein
MRANATFPLRCAVAILATLALGACADGPSVARGTDPAPVGTAVITTPPPIPGARSCDNPSPIHAVAHGLEAQGKMRGAGSLFAFFAGVDALTADTPITAYWRLGGSRALRVTLIGPGDRVAHATSVRPGVPAFTWDHPGEPWSSVVTFPQSGCWRVYVERAGADGDLWVRVT